MTRIRADTLPVFTQSKGYEDLSPVSVTDAETSVTFSSQRKAVLVYNDGTSDCHFSTSTGVTTSNFRIPKASSISMVFPITSLFFICAAGETATLYVIGER